MGLAIQLLGAPQLNLNSQLIRYQFCKVLQYRLAESSHLPAERLPEITENLGPNFLQQNDEKKKSISQLHQACS